MKLFFALLSKKNCQIFKICQKIFRKLTILKNFDRIDNFDKINNFEKLKIFEIMENSPRTNN